VKLFQHPSVAALGRGTRRLIRFVAIAVMIGIIGFGALAVLVGLADHARKQGWTAETVSHAILGLAFLTFEWLLSWPGYIWLGLVVVILLMNVSSQLAALNYNVHALTEAVRGLKAQPNDDEFDEDDF
jgi:hypothetical protein